MRSHISREYEQGYASSSRGLDEELLQGQKHICGEKEPKTLATRNKLRHVVISLMQVHKNNHALVTYLTNRK